MVWASTEEEYASELEKSPEGKIVLIAKILYVAERMCTALYIYVFV